MSESLALRMVAIDHKGLVSIVSRNGRYWNTYKPSYYSYRRLMRVLANKGIQPKLYDTSPTITFTLEPRPAKG